MSASTSSRSVVVSGDVSGLDVPHVFRATYDDDNARPVAIWGYWPTAHQRIQAQGQGGKQLIRVLSIHAVMAESWSGDCAAGMRAMLAV